MLIDDKEIVFSINNSDSRDMHMEKMDGDTLYTADKNNFLVYYRYER